MAPQPSLHGPQYGGTPLSPPRDAPNPRAEVADGGGAVSWVLGIAEPSFCMELLFLPQLKGKCFLTAFLPFFPTAFSLFFCPNKNNYLPSLLQSLRFPAPSYRWGGGGRARPVAGRYNLHLSSIALIAPSQKLKKIFAIENQPKKKRRKKEEEKGKNQPNNNKLPALKVKSKKGSARLSSSAGADGEAFPARRDGCNLAATGRGAPGWKSCSLGADAALRSQQH